MIRLLSRKTNAVALRCAIHLPPAPVRQRPRSLARDALEFRPLGDLRPRPRPSRLDLPLQLPIDGIRRHRRWPGGWPDRRDHLTSPGDGHRFTALDAPENGGGLVLQLSHRDFCSRSHVATYVATWPTAGQPPRSASMSRSTAAASIRRQNAMTRVDADTFASAQLRASSTHRIRLPSRAARSSASLRSTYCGVQKPTISSSQWRPSRRCCNAKSERSGRRRRLRAPAHGRRPSPAQSAGSRARSALKLAVIGMAACRGRWGRPTRAGGPGAEPGRCSPPAGGGPLHRLVLAPVSLRITGASAREPR
jgi:hypothetical protein